LRGEKEKGKARLLSLSSLSSRHPREKKKKGRGRGPRRKKKKKRRDKREKLFRFVYLSFFATYGVGGGEKKGRAGRGGKRRRQHPLLPFRFICISASWEKRKKEEKGGKGLSKGGREEGWTRDSEQPGVEKGGRIKLEGEEKTKKGEGGGKERDPNSFYRTTEEGEKKKRETRRKKEGEGKEMSVVRPGIARRKGRARPRRKKRKRLNTERGGDGKGHREHTDVCPPYLSTSRNSESEQERGGKKGGGGEISRRGGEGGKERDMGKME